MQAAELASLGSMLSFPKISSLPSLLLNVTELAKLGGGWFTSAFVA